MYNLYFALATVLRLPVCYMIDHTRFLHHFFSERSPRYRHVWIIIILSILISTLFFFTSYKVEILPRDTNIPMLRENSQDCLRPNIPLNNGNQTYINGKQTFQTPVDYRKETARISHNGTQADDPYLVELIRRFWIRSPPTGPYKFKNKKTDYSTHGQSVIIDNTLKNKVRFTQGDFNSCNEVEAERTK